MPFTISELAQALLDALGGALNVQNLSLNQERMRFRLQNDSLLRQDQIKRMKGIVGTIEADGYFFVVPQKAIAEALYKALQQQMGPQVPPAKTPKAGVGRRLRTWFFGVMKKRTPSDSGA
ncbi:hypothetical protein ABB02_00015 [Clostridiaceae bacterium JG1575]|nr:hypothetical protein ABB02_00015 [Clostridiaceae bacterium JG1575]